MATDVYKVMVHYSSNGINCWQKDKKFYESTSYYNKYFKKFKDMYRKLMERNDHFKYVVRGYKYEGDDWTLIDEYNPEGLLL